MASISVEPNGRRMIQFIGADGKRRSIRLGKSTARQAEAFKVRVEQLAAAVLSGTGVVDDETARWVAGLDDTMHQRLAAVGLVKSRARTGATLGAYLEEFFKSVAGTVKASTMISYGNVRRNLLDFFDVGRPLRSIEPVEADQWRQSMKASGLAEPTISRRVGIARQIFRRAVKWHLLAENPFADVRMGTQVNRERMFYVPRETAQKVLDACPDAEWRLLFCLSRYAGLRTPSESLALRWADVDWTRNRMLVHSPKTEHHQGHDSRWVPIFPELRPYLLDAYEQADTGAEYVITRYRDPTVNLRTQLRRIIHKAGGLPWPKLWANMRSSCEIDLCERWPEHVVATWMGHQTSVARKHYLHVTEAHFEAAATTPSGALQNPVQYSAVRACKGADGSVAPVKKANVYGVFEETPGVPMGDRGLEPLTLRV